jgi:hypothetical protein
VTLADDDDAVGPRHPTEAGDCDSEIATLELAEDGGRIHPSMIVVARAARQVPGGPFSGEAGSYQYPREKKPRSASTKITIRMIQRMLMRFLPPCR